MAGVKRIPQRMCVGCREHYAKQGMVRVVKTPESNVVVDLTGKAAGRGAYLCRKLECLQRATKTRALQRALKIDVNSTILDNIASQLVSQNDPG